MTSERTQLKTGDWVQVRNPAEIAQTLDAHGTLDGLPFMPEMIGYCGRRFRVLRRAEKSCVEIPGGRYKIREFRQNDVVVLDGLRCSGANHDACQRACLLFWKTAWLNKLEHSEVTPETKLSDEEALRSRLRTTTENARYFCQSTELSKATQPLTRPRILSKCLYDLRSGSRRPLEMAWLVLAPLWRKLTRRWPRRKLTGTLKRTPVGNLNLQPGELVEVKPAAEIAQTLDDRGRNRGLQCDFGMCQYSGGKFRVRNRLDRMISESTGQMRIVEGT